MRDHQRDTDALVGISSWLLARDIRSYQALAAGLPVPRHKLQPAVLEALNMDIQGEPVVMSVELALLIEIYRPYDLGSVPDMPKRMSA